MTGVKTIQVYVDGFNLYRRALMDTEFKWLDLAELMRTILPGYEVIRVKYFTAWVMSSPHNNYVRARQQAYVRAIQHDPLVEVHLGHFRRDSVPMPIHP